MFYDRSFCGTSYSSRLCICFQSYTDPLGIHRALIPELSVDTKIHGCSSPLQLTLHICGFCIREFHQSLVQPTVDWTREYWGWAVNDFQPVHPLSLILYSYHLGLRFLLARLRVQWSDSEFFFLNAWSKLCLYQTLSLHGKKGHCCSSIITLSFAHWSHSMKSPSWPGNSQSIRYSKEKDVTHLAPPKSLLVFWRVRSILKAQHPSLLLIGSTGPIHSLYYNQHSFLPSPWWITFLASVLRVSKDRRWFTGTVQDILFTLLFCDFSRMMIFGGHWYVSKIHTLYAHRLKELYTSVWNSSLDASMLLSTSENICHCPRICVYSYLRPIFSPYQVDDLVPVSADYGQWSNHLFL